MARVLRMPASRAKEALVRFRHEQVAFRHVLEVLMEWRREDLFLKLHAVYRSRMRMHRNLAGDLLADAEEPYVAEELRHFARRHDP